MTMTKLAVTINNADRARQAAEWCRRHKIPYNLEFWGWPGSKIYKFVFDQQDDLVNFSLKWV